MLTLYTSLPLSVCVNVALFVRVYSIDGVLLCVCVCVCVTAFSYYRPLWVKTQTMNDNSLFKHSFFTALLYSNSIAVCLPLQHIENHFLWSHDLCVIVM